LLLVPIYPGVQGRNISVVRIKGGELGRATGGDCQPKAVRCLVAPISGEEFVMKNVWKGLVIGGLTGVAAGVVLDVLDRGARQATVLGDKVAHQAPEVVGRLRHAVSDAVAEGASRVRDPEVAEQAKEITLAAKKTGEVVSDGKTRATAAAADTKEMIGSALSDGKAKTKSVANTIKEAP
jgi:hypothetical protein